MIGGEAAIRPAFCHSQSIDDPAMPWLGFKGGSQSATSMVALASFGENIDNAEKLGVELPKTGLDVRREKVAEMRERGKKYREIAADAK